MHVINGQSAQAGKCSRRGLLVAGAAHSGLVAAQTEEAQTLSTVVVTASGFEQHIEDAPASISVITREELEKGSYRDMHDALRNVPGVILTPSDNNSKDISLRGMAAQYTLILVDGKRLSTRETQANGSTGTDQSWVPPLEAIDRIEVVRGPMSSLYGSDAMGGVINIITRPVPKEWTGSVRLDGFIQQHSRSGDEHRGNFYLAGPIKDELLGLSLQGVYSKRAEDKVLDGYNKNETRGLTARLSLTPNADHDLILEAGATQQDFTSTPGKTLEPSEALSHREFNREHYSLTHRGRWGFATSDTYVQQERIENVGRDMTIRNTTANTSWTLPLGQDHLLTVGAFFDEQKLDDTTSNSLSDLSRINRTQYAVFAENEWSITDDFALTTGLRYDHDDKAGSHLSPRVYGVWHMNDYWTLKGGVSTGFKAPSLRQTIPDWGAVSRGGDRYGNPNLEPEKSLSKEIGVVYNDREGLEASLMLFDNEFKDKITRVPCPECGPVNRFGRGPTTYVNVDDAVTRGVEASLTTSLTDTVTLNSSYTYTYSQQRSGEYAGEPLNQLPRHMFNMGLDWNPNEQVNAWAKLSFRGKESDPTTGPSSSSMVAPSLTLLDLGGSYTVNKSTTLYAGIYNVFDKTVFYEDYGYVEDGRRLWVGMNYRF